MQQANTRTWFLHVLKPLKPAFREVLGMALFINVLALAVPIFVLQVYDRVVFHAGLSTLRGLVLGMVAVLVFDFVLRQSRARLLQRVALQVDVVVGRELFNKLTCLPLQTLESRPSAYWQALFRDVDVVRNTVSGASALLLADLPFAFLFLALTFVIAPPIAWILLIILPLFLLVAWRSGNTMARASMEERDTALARDRLISEIIAGRTTVKALALDEAMRPVWEERHADTIERAIARGGKADGYANLGTTLSMLTTVSLTAVGAVAIVNQELSIGALIAANMLSGRLIGPLNQLVGSWRNFTVFGQAIDRLGHIFNMPGDRQKSAIELKRPRGAVTLEKLSFSYANAARPTIDGIELSLPASGVHALIGRNGSGKSTVLKLLQGLYPPSAGRVLLDGADIKQFTRSELARWIGYVPQECVLFAGTLRENICHRHPAASDEDVIDAATAAGVHSFIVDLADGYATDIGEAGHRLSAGQRQRIAIARALVGRPPLLLLDEPSSNLDREAETDLGNSLAAIGRSQTVLIVTHSPVLLSLCHRIFALDRGRVILSGPAIEVLPRILNRDRPSHSPITAGKGLAEGPGAPPDMPASLVRETGAP